MVLNNFICQICAVQFDIRRNVIVTESPISNSNSQVPRQEGWIGAVAESGNGPQARTCRVSGEVLFTGYDGATISAAELKVSWPLTIPCLSSYKIPSPRFPKLGSQARQGINQARFLVPKPSFAAPPPDETDYERVSDVFVTSLTTISSDWSSSWHFVPRYGIMGYNVHAENHLAGYDQFRGWRGVGGRSRQSVCGVPVHDACWKVFMKVCEAKLGAVDLQGFYALWEVCDIRGKHYKLVLEADLVTLFRGKLVRSVDFRICNRSHAPGSVEGGGSHGRIIQERR